MLVAQKMMLQVAVRDIGQLTDFAEAGQRFCARRIGDAFTGTAVYDLVG
jgi:hypothetical protein